MPCHHRWSLVIAMVALAAGFASAQNQALSLVTSNTVGYAEVGSNPTLTTPALTFEAWVIYNDATLPTGYCYPTIGRKNPAGSAEEWLLRVDAGNTSARTIKWTVRTTSAASATWSFAAGQLLNWTHIAGTYDGATAKLYVNGVQVASASLAGSVANTGGLLRLGAGDTLPTGAKEVWNGQIDEIRLWSYARTAEQIQAGMFQTISTAPGLQGSWHLDGDALDASGNNNHGTLFPPTTFGPATLPVQEYQLNRAGARLLVNNTVGNGVTAPVVNQAVYTACPPLVPATGTVALSSTNLGLPWDLVLSPLPLVSASQGALTLGDGQMVNLNVTGPLTFINNFLATGFPGAWLPGMTTSTLSTTYSLSAQTDVSFQGIVVNPASPSGVDLSQGTELHVNLLPALATVAGPSSATSSTSVAVNLTANPTCWLTGGLTAFGTTYTTIQVSSEGRVVFGNTASNVSAPTQALGLTHPPFVGFWTDLDPVSGGASITITHPAPTIVRVNYNNCRYSGEAAATATFAIQFDAATGIIVIDGLTGIQANPQTVLGTGDAQFLGLSKGTLGATNGGLTTFATGVPGSSANATQMIFDFYTQIAGGAGRCASLIPGTLNTITFVPSAAFPTNYDWIGG